MSLTTDAINRAVAATNGSPHEFVITEIRVYPTARPEDAREIEVPPQTIKLQAISRRALPPEELRRLGLLST
jgi:hypothetical protein